MFRLSLSSKTYFTFISITENSFTTTILLSVRFPKYKCMLFWLKLPTTSYAMYCFEMIPDTVPNAMRGRFTGTANCDSAKVCEGRNSNEPTANTLKCFDRKQSEQP